MINIVLVRNFLKRVTSFRKGCVGMKFFPTLEQAKEFETYKQIPLATEIFGEFDAEIISETLKTVSENVFILESCEESQFWGRYSFLGYDPLLEVTCKDHKVVVTENGSARTMSEGPHQVIRDLVAAYESPHFSELPSFTGGLVGYFAYEFMKYAEPTLDLPCEVDHGFQDVDLMLFHKIIAIDRLEKKLVLMVNFSTKNFEKSYETAQKELEAMKKLLDSGERVKPAEGKLLAPLTPAFSKETFCDMVEKSKHYIHEGDIFQVVLSNPLSAPYEGSIFNTYRNLKEINPSPYLFYFSSPHIELAGASPETLVKLDQGKVTTFPLAGTRPRGKTEEQDKNLEKELLADPKERAEHNMLVDLGRNDIGKISDFGSVKVEQYMEIQRFSHVMHIGSTVSGTLRKDLDYLDAIDGILPAGTLSGAPKIRACEIIHELEGQKRGIYGGAVGYIDFCGNMDTCIAIRLVFRKDGQVFVRSGAGIVADSVGEREFEECIHKAKAVVVALE